jgi:hypothetical protein
MNELTPTPHANTAGTSRRGTEVGLLHTAHTQRSYSIPYPPLLRRILAESSGSAGGRQEAVGHRNQATTRVYMQRIAVKRDKFDTEVAKRMKL